ncbi:hypothetical protein AAZX31_14G098600 [Glycine max]|uniref:Protein BIG GRAIN 1-like A n=2 Tax=Glycine subgen. Soja TaxID=1462606 RepID=K7M5Y9_SOYBN|nr:protein BIG GRAIN 1-like B [Glycine max]XP_028199325.1 protein BIG GRAIN 1-like B [Glycine soja]KAH1093902.1 hypothetical protein GYH30_039567 [Glycine max]KAH1212442.1 Protein BIG GRAIN 1-like A [Glycine max]KRH15613.1 hypothetical protein GLYMA_14G099400v4 [Glycine max]RZB68387.1 Protein BIG GRAIN 1-like A [Glycine soja]|eukprot:XP_003545393.1 protein BIG GRAIN 1-like B [Glycine max]
MYHLEKPQRDDKQFLTPSFSSTLLDQIYRSIDEGERKNGEIKFYRHTTMSTSKRQSRSNSKSMDAGDRKIVRAKNGRKKLHCDEDIMFFSSTSISSTDSSSLGFSSSDTESISRASCFAPRVGRRGGGSASFRSEKQGMRVLDGFCRNSSHRSKHAHSPLPVSSRHHVSVSEQQRHEHVTACDEEALMIKSKSRALRIYNNLKKVKQPLSPGGRVTSFLNSLFANTKKTTSTTSRSCGEGNAPSSSSSCYYSSTCSSASSFSRSCLSKTMSSERDRLRNGVKRTVRFYPVSVIVDEDSRPCGDKRLCEEEEASGEFLREYNRHNSKIKSNDNLVLKDLPLRKTNLVEDGDDNDDHDDDASSYASSDLFELDHLAVFGSGRYSEELPVYETTHVSTNRAIANGLIV